MGVLKHAAACRSMPQRAKIFTWWAFFFITCQSCEPFVAQMFQNWMVAQWSMGEYPHRARTARAPRMHRARTVRAPRQVFEQLLQEIVYGERSCRWYLLGSEALPFPLIGSG